MAVGFIIGGWVVALLGAGFWYMTHGFSGKRVFLAVVCVSVVASVLLAFAVKA